MKFRILFIALLVSTLSFSKNDGTITGVLTDKSLNQKTLPSAKVIIKEANISTNTDADGKFSIAIQPGTYIVEFSLAGYESTEVMVTVNEGQTTITNESLVPTNYNLKEVVIKATGNREKETAILLDQKNAVVIKQSIGAQEMSRKGISDVEEGLTKITGITKVGSRGLFVRGLEDRYNNLLINDLAAPTNNPFKKIIPLDLFSTDIVGVIEVYKTFNPNIYGDFAGGTFNIQTSKGSKSVTKLNVGVGYTVNNNLEKFLISKDANSTKGLFGLTGSDRELPGLLGNTPSSYTLTADESLRSFKSGFDVSEIKSPLNSSIGFLHSEKFNLKDDKTFSYLLSLNFDNNYAIREGVDRSLFRTGTTVGYNHDFENTEYRYKTSLSSLIGFNYNSKKLNLSYNTLYIKTSENLIKDQFGYAAYNAPNKKLVRTNQLDQSNYLNNQLLGEYALNEDKNQTIKAGLSYAKTKYEQPDRKSFSGPKSGADDIIVSIAGNNFIRQYLDITGDSYFSGLTEYRLKFGKDGKNNIFTAGYNGNASNMESSYRFIIPTTGPTFTTPINNIDTQLNNYIASGTSFNFRESSNNSYQAKLNESANAGYVNLFYKFNAKWEVNGGLRFENTLRETKYRTQGSFDDPFTIIKHDDKYLLPSLNVKYGVNEKSNLRFAVAKTYTRPVIMEAYPIEYINADGTSMKGNPNLVNSENYNADLKYELFPTSKEIFAVGIFGKSITDPIERTFEANATTSTIITYLNSEKAVLYGAEIEFILDLARLNKNLSAFSFGFNTSLMQTKAEVKPNLLITHSSRALQGASKWLVNSDLKYQFNLNKSWSNTISIVYAVFGKRIYAIGTDGLDDIYEIPVQQLDFVWSSKLSNHFDLKFSADNLLDPSRQLELGENSTVQKNEQSPTTNSYKKGRGFSINLGYTF